MPSSVPSTEISRIAVPPYISRLEHVLPEVVGAEEPLVGERRPDDLVLAVGREERTEDGEQHHGQR